MDFIAICEKANVFYVIEALQFIIAHTPLLSPFAELCFWSDGSSKEFKNRFVQWFFSFLQLLYGKRCSYSYFASHHGKSLCDAHAYHVKHAVTQLFLEKERSLGLLMSSPGRANAASDSTKLFAVDVGEVVATVSSHVSHTFAFRMPPLQKQSLWKENATHLRGIKKMHSFNYTLSRDGHQAHSKIHLSEFNRAPEKLAYSNFCLLNVAAWCNR